MLVEFEKDTIDLLKHFSNLKELTLYDCSFKNLPKEIYNLKKLKSLKVFRNAEIIEVSEKICNLENLEELYFVGKEVHLPNCLNKLKNLKKIFFVYDGKQYQAADKKFYYFPTKILEIPNLEDITLSILSHEFEIPPPYYANSSIKNIKINDCRYIYIYNLENYNDWAIYNILLNYDIDRKLYYFEKEGYYLEVDYDYAANTHNTGNCDEYLLPSSNYIENKINLTNLVLYPNLETIYIDTERIIDVNYNKEIKIINFENNDFIYGNPLTRIQKLSKDKLISYLKIFFDEGKLPKLKSFRSTEVKNFQFQKNNE